MKSLSVKLGVILIGLAIFTYAEVWGADWKLYAAHESFLAYYDTQSITRPSKNIVRVQTRSDITERGVLYLMRERGNEYENLNHFIILSEINCIEKKVRSLSITYYDNKGGVIYSSSSPGQFDSIVPGTNVEILYKEVCK
jgi:hypothetical protein